MTSRRLQPSVSTVCELQAEIKGTKRTRLPGLLCMVISRISRLRRPVLHVAMEHANKKTWERLLGQFVGRAEGLTSRAGGRLGAEVGYTCIVHIS